MYYDVTRNDEANLAVLQTGLRAQKVTRSDMQELCALANEADGIWTGFSSCVQKQVKLYFAVK